MENVDSKSFWFATATLTSRRSSLSNSSVGSTTPLVNVVLTDARRPTLAWNGSGVWKDVTTENGEVNDCPSLPSALDTCLNLT